MPECGGYQMRGRAHLRGDGRMDASGTMSRHLGHTCLAAETLDVLSHPVPGMGEEPRAWIVTACLRTLPEERSQRIGYLEHSATVLGLAVRDPEHPSLIVHITPADVDDLLCSHGQVHRDQDRERRKSTLSITVAGRLRVIHARLLDRERDHIPGFMDAELLLALAPFAAPFHLGEWVPTDPALLDAP